MAVQPTGKITASAFDQIDPPDAELQLDCVHCGFCLPTCPTYLVLGNEMDSPRGRIYLIRAASEGKIGISDNFVRHMNLCLLCRACETACPSGVKFGFLMESARGQIERHYQYSAADRRFKHLILRTFTDPRRLRAVTGLLSFYQRSGLQKLVRASGTLRLFGRLGKMEALLPAIPDKRRRKELPEVMPANARRAETFSKKVRDVSQLLAQAPLNGRLRALKRVVTYHDACHLAHGQKVRQEPRTILKAIPGLQFVELRESDFCCGSAGIYNLLYPELARQFLDRKIERIKETGAEVVVSGNPGCSLQIEKGLKERGLNVRVVHPVELLDWSYQGTEG